MDPDFRRDDDGVWRASGNTLLGALAMALTVGIGRVVGTSV